MLQKAIATRQNELWLAQQIRGNFLNSYQRSTGTTAAVPINAHLTLAEGEFNRYYMRGLCLRAIEEKIPMLIIERVKGVLNPRASSQRRLGASVDPNQLLADLRQYKEETVLEVPGGPNSGISVRLPLPTPTGAAQA